MKGIKRYFGIIMGIMLMLAALPSMPAHASGRVVIAVSASSLNIGDTVTVTVTAQNESGEQVSSALDFQYDSSRLSFVSCDSSQYSGGEGGSLQVTASRVRITLKATAAGSASVSASSSDGLTAGGTTLEVKDQTAGETAKSGDNSLASLSISPGTLSPAFQYSTTSYTAAVDSGVTEVSVDARTSNANAVVESITGNTNLKEGENTISILVKAENGATAVYKIVVTRGGAAVQTPQEETPAEGTGEGDPGTVILNGHEYNLAAAIPEDRIPADFTKTTVNCQGQEVEALQYNMGDVVLVYLTTPDTAVKNTMAVYDQQSGSIYPFVKIETGSSYFIILNPPAETGLPEIYTAASIEIGESGTVNAYGSQEPDLSDFYLLYAVSNRGNTGWYQYDKSEGTLQRYIQQTEEATVDEEALSADMKSLQNAYDKLDKQYSKEKSSARRAMAVLIFIIAVLIVVIVNLLLRRRKEEEWEDDFHEVPRRFREKEEKPSRFGMWKKKLWGEAGLEEEDPEEEEWEAAEEQKAAGDRKDTRDPEVTRDLGNSGKLKEPKRPEGPEEPEDAISPEPSEEAEKREGKRKWGEKKKKPEKKAPVKEKPEEPEEQDDFEVIDLDDL